MSDLTSPKNPFMKPEYVIKVALAGWEFRDRRAAELAMILAHNMAQVPRKPVIVVRGPEAVGKSLFVRQFLAGDANFEQPKLRDVLKACTKSDVVCVDSVRASKTGRLSLDLYWAMMFARHQHINIAFGLGPRAKTVAGPNSAALVLTTSDDKFPRRHADLCMLNIDVVACPCPGQSFVPLEDVQEAARALFAGEPTRDWWDFVRDLDAGAEVLP